MRKKDALNKLDSYKQNLIRKELSKSTIERYLYDICQCLDKMPEFIEKENLITYKEDIKKIYQLGTLNNKIIAINSFLNYLELNELKLKTSKKVYGLDEENVISKQEYNKLLNYCISTKRYKMYYIIRTLANTGIRVSELKFVKVEYVKNGYVKVFNKGKERKIYFSPKLQKLIIEFCNLKRINNGIIFRGADGISSISRFTINSNLKLLAKKCNIKKEKVHAHSFRHLFAKEFLKVEKNIFELAKILGHKSVDTTMIYSNMTYEEKRDSLNKLDL